MSWLAVILLQDYDWDPPFADLASSPWKNYKSIVSAYRRAPVKRPYKWKLIVRKPHIKERREAQPWFEETIHAPRLSQLDRQQMEEDHQATVMKRKKKKTQHGGRAGAGDVDEEEDEEEEEEGA